VKEHLREIVGRARHEQEGAHIAREYLQALILSSMQRAGAFVHLAFHGGTALRVLYQIPRYSEDLDFALESDPDGFDFSALIRAVRRELASQGYSPEIRVRDERTVQRAIVGFPGLLHDLDLSPHPTQNMTIRIEIDTLPPAGASTTTSLVNRYVMLNLNHHDRSSLLAGKIHALLRRPFTKGRDIFDLCWYLSASDWPLQITRC